MAAGSAAGALACSRRYGSKAANLGFLTHQTALGRRGDEGSPSARLEYDLVPAGLGVPLQFYRDLVDYEPNGGLRAKLAALIEAEKAGTLSGNERLRHVDEVQTAFLTAKFPPENLKRIKDKLKEVLPGVNKIKVRSSANAEDIPNFDGAGPRKAEVPRHGGEDPGRRAVRLQAGAGIRGAVGRKKIKEGGNRSGWKSSPGCWRTVASGMLRLRSASA